MICCPFARILRGRGGCGAKNHPRVKCGCVLRRFSPSSRNSALLRRAERHKTAAPLRAFRRKSRDRMCICRTAHAHSDKCHLVRAAPRHPANVSRSQIEICQRSPFYDSSNRKSWGPAPPAWVPILCLTTAREKTLVMVVGVTQWDQPPARQVFLLFTKSVEKPVGVLSGKRFRGCCFCSRKIEQKIVYFGEVFARVSLYIYYRQQLKGVLFWVKPVMARL